MKHSKFTDAIPTRAFLVPLDEDEEVEVEISKGNIIHIKYRAMGELQPNGTRSPPHLCCCFTALVCSFCFCSSSSGFPTLQTHVSIAHVMRTVLHFYFVLLTGQQPT